MLLPPLTPQCTTSRPRTWGQSRYCPKSHCCHAGWLRVLLLTTLCNHRWNMLRRWLFKDRIFCIKSLSLGSHFGKYCVALFKSCPNSHVGCKTMNLRSRYCWCLWTFFAAVFFFLKLSVEIRFFLTFVIAKPTLVSSWKQAMNLPVSGPLMTFYWR